MELTLNLVWLLISIASFAYTIRRAVGFAPGAARRRFVIQGLLSLSCALLVLFPVISITDDLHSDSYVAEESSALRRSWISASAISFLVDHSEASVPAVILFTPLLLAALIIFLHRVEASSPSFTSIVLDERCNPRSPPFAL